jgi:demethylmenaquinone methyltransferase / 2-methoxy-6-polyprenyl-1,4-benzoquinol methylase
MPNEYFDPGEQRAFKVKALFERIASRYDLLNDVQSFGLHRRWKRRVFECARPERGERSLDICCGTGDLTLGFARQGLQAVGLDFSEGMLGIAAKRKVRLDDVPERREREAGESFRAVDKLATRSSVSSPEFIRADAQHIPFKDASFEIVTVGYGLRNLTSWEAGLSEMCRVARPGARLLVLDFGKPENPLWRSFYFWYLRLFVPLLGLLFCGSASAYAYILESLKHYPAQRGVAAKMRDLGLVNVQIIDLLGGAMSINYAEKSVQDRKQRARG